MSDTLTVSGARYNALAEDMSALIIKHTTLGSLGLDEALSIIVAVATDYARDAYDDPADALCSLVIDRMRRPMPERMPIGPQGAA